MNLLDDWRDARNASHYKVRGIVSTTVPADGHAIGGLCLGNFFAVRHGNFIALTRGNFVAPDADQEERVNLCVKN